MTTNEKTIQSPSLAGQIISWLFGIVALAIGIINTFWGNDPGYGIFIFCLAFLFFPPVSDFLKNISGIGISKIFKIVLALFILWSALGVGELFDKIDLMLTSFQ